MISLRLLRSSKVGRCPRIVAERFLLDRHRACLSSSHMNRVVWFSHDGGNDSSKQDVVHIYEKRVDSSKRQHVSSLEFNKTTNTWISLPAKDFPRAVQDEEKEKTNASNEKNMLHSLEEWTQTIVHYFLPARYPQSVAPGYARFASLGFLASIAGSASMVLSTQTLLLAVGVVGSSSAHEASIMAGALNWVLKDGIGQFGGVLFASYMGQLRSIDANPKQWRMVAAVSLDVATLLEITSPLWPAYCVLPLASIANVGKNIGFLTASASRAALHQALSISNNLADVTAKSATQSMAASLIGTAVGIGLSCVLHHEIAKFAMAFGALSVIHQLGNFASLQSVPLTSFNQHRLHLVVRHYVATQQILTPTEVAQVERYLPIVHADESHRWLSVGTKLTKLLPNDHGKSNDWSRLLQSSDCPTGNEAYRMYMVQKKIHLIFLEHATGSDLIRGMLHAHLLQDVLHQEHSNASSGIPAITANDDSVASSSWIAQTHLAVTNSFPVMQQGLLEKGWKLGDEFVTIEPSRAVRLCIDKERM